MRLREVQASDLPGPVIVRTTDGTWGVLDARPPGLGKSRRLDSWHTPAFSVARDAILHVLDEDEHEDEVQAAGP